MLHIGPLVTRMWNINIAYTLYFGAYTVTYLRAELVCLSYMHLRHLNFLHVISPFLASVVTLIHSFIPGSRRICSTNLFHRRLFVYGSHRPAFMLVVSCAKQIVFLILELSCSFFPQYDSQVHKYFARI